MAWLKLEHQMVAWCKENQLNNCSVALACSGGADSVALLDCFHRIHQALKLRIVTFHIHHGDNANENFRDHALNFVQALCAERVIPFYTKKAEGLLLRSEEELREFRLEALEQLRLEHKIDYIAFAHHAEDQLETRLYRLIRGTGLFGLKAMTTKGDGFIRPFLGVPRGELRTYLAERNVAFSEDPTNSEQDAFRNWMRNEWLVQLEEKRPGALKSLARSLANILEEAAPAGTRFDAVHEDYLDLPAYLALTPELQLSALAQFLREQGLYQFSRGQLLELQKQLLSKKARYRFHMVGVGWIVNAGRISLNSSDI